MQPPLELPPIPALLIAILSVQGGAALAKGLFPVLGPTGTVGLRIGVSAVILLAIFRPSLKTTPWRAVIPYGISLGLMNWVFYQALARIPLGLAVTVEFVGPLGVAVWGSRKPLDVLWVIMAGAGIALITPWTGQSSVDPLGVFCALLAGLCWAAYIVLGGRLSQVLPGGAAVATGMLVAALTVLPACVLAGSYQSLTPQLFAAGIGVAVLSSAIPYSMEMIALKALPSRVFGILMSLEPAMAALSGLLFLDEVLTVTQWVAILLVIAASVGSTRTKP